MAKGVHALAFLSLWNVSRCYRLVRLELKSEGFKSTERIFSHSVHGWRHCCE